MRKLGATVLIAAGVLVSSAANAQSWGVYVGNAPRQGIMETTAKTTTGTMDSEQFVPGSEPALLRQS